MAILALQLGAFAMAKSIFCRVGTESDFYDLFALAFSAQHNLKLTHDEVRRRLIIPLFLEQLIVFYDEN
jgi:hypothetical protein